MFVCKALTHEAEIEELAEGWRSLQAERGLSPFTDFDWVWTWWTSLGKPEGSRMLVIACWEEGRLVGVLPFCISKKYGALILRYVSYDAFYMRNLLATSNEVMRALWQKLRESNGFDFADIKNVHEGTAEESILKEFATSVEASPVYFREHKGLTRDTFFKAYTKRFRRKLYKIEEVFREKKEFAFGIDRDGAFLDEAIPFLVEEKLKWCRQNGKTGLFDSDRVEIFYRALCKTAIRQGLFRLFWLRKNEKLVAVLLCFLGRDTLYAHTTAHTPSVRQVHPGLFLKSEAMVWASEAGLRETNFMEGREYFKVRFSSSARIIHEFVFAQTLKGRLFALAYKSRLVLRKMKRRDESE